MFRRIDLTQGQQKLIKEVILFCIFWFIAMMLSGCAVISAVDATATVASTAVKGVANTTGAVVGYATGSSARSIEAEQAKTRQYRQALNNICTRHPTIAECSLLNNR